VCEKVQGLKPLFIGRNRDCEEMQTILTLQPKLCNSTYEIFFPRECNIKMCRLFRV